MCKKTCKNCGYCEPISIIKRVVIINGLPYKYFCTSHGVKHPIGNYTICDLYQPKNGE